MRATNARRPLTPGTYVVVGGTLYSARSAAARHALTVHGPEFVPIDRWTGSEWRSTGRVLHRTRPAGD